MASSFLELSVEPTPTGTNSIELSLDQPKKQDESDDSERIYPDTGGGFSYAIDSKITKHRQIIWKVIGNTLSLEEVSMDHNLFGNKLEISVPGETLLPNVVIVEQEEEVHVLIATINTVHKLTFVHPNHCKYGFIVPSGVHVAFPSIFNESSSEYKHETMTLSQPCISFDAISIDGTAYFGLITDSRNLLVASMTGNPADSLCVELKDATVMQRLWTGLVPSLFRGDGTGNEVEDIVVHCFGPLEIFALVLCRDLKIRIWDFHRQTCVLVKDLSALIPERDDTIPEMGISALHLTKSNSQMSPHAIVAAHCSFANSSKFIVLEVSKDQRDISVTNVSNFHSSLSSVQHVSLTSQFIFAMWNTRDGGHLVSYAPIEGGNLYEQGWHPVHMKDITKHDLFIPLYQDAKEIYLNHLFSVGCLNKESILKALEVFTKTLDTEGTIPDAGCELSVIKEAVVNTLELEIEQNVIARDVDPGDYQELQHECWSKFYSFVQQIHEQREQPLGLYVSDDNDVAMVVRRESCGYLFPTEWIDHLYLTDLGSCEALESYISDALKEEDPVVAQDIQIILDCLKSIPGEFDSEVILGIDHDLDRNEDIKPFLTSMATTLLSNSSEFEQLIGDPVQRGSFSSQLHDRLKHIKDPENSIDVILNALQSSEVTDESIYEESTNSLTSSAHGPQFLCGKIGIDILSQLLKITSLNRMHLCRDFFILLKVMDKIGPSTAVSNDYGTLKSNSCYELLRSYHAVYWSAHKAISKTDPSTIDTSVNHLAALHLTEPNQSTTEITDDLPVSILTGYIRNVGLKNALTSTASGGGGTMQLKSCATPEMLRITAKSIAHGIWLLNEGMSDFPQYLSVEHQFCALMEYLRLSHDWNTFGRGTRDYLLAQAYLGVGEPNKALNYFFSAARGINTKESFLMSLITEETGRRDRALVEYFVKVMRLFEQAEYPSYVISAATSALTITGPDDPNIPMLWSVIFKYHLELEHYNDAYATIIHNTDKHRRHDCLKHFIVTLCDAGLFQEICAYPYTNLEEEVVGILEARARTMDITVNQYYDLLYSYHIMKGDYRSASSAQYEHACRLITEMHGTKSLQKQAKCYLSAIAALKLVPAKDAWIVRYRGKVSSVGNTQKSEEEYSQSPKRREDGEEIYYSSRNAKKTNKTVIVELGDLEKEYLLIFSRLKLIQLKESDTIAVGPSLSAGETVGLLAQAGLFDTAFSVAVKFNLTFKNIFENLASKCAQLVNYKPSQLDERWKWLSYNELGTSQILTNKNATSQAFHLLQAYLKKFQVNKSSVHYKAVTAKFLSLGCALPSWLIQLYESTNPAELLHMYLCFDMVVEATQLSLKYIDAVLGHGKEYLGLNTALHATTPAVWLPYTSFDQLVSALRENYDKPEVAVLCDALQDKLDDYFMKAEMVSLDKLNYLHQVNASQVMVE